MEVRRSFGYKQESATSLWPMNYVVVAALVSGGLIHMAPLVGVLGPDKLASLYGMNITDKSLELLLRHRAVLFGLVGCALLASVLVPTLRLPALLAGTVSAAAFVLLAWTIGGYTPELARVVRIDLVVLPVLVAGLGILVFSSPKT